MGKYKSNFLLLILCIGLLPYAYGQQQEKPLIAVLPIKYDAKGTKLKDFESGKGESIFNKAVNWLDKKVPQAFGHEERKAPQTSLNTQLKDLQDKVVARLLKEKRLNIVERANWDLISSEKELQKDEAFIDGKIVAQSKGLGAEYVLLGVLNKEKTNLTFTLLDVSDKSLIARANCSKTQIGRGINSLLRGVFPLQFKVIKYAKANDSVPCVVIFGAKNSGVSVHHQFVIKKITPVEVNGVVLDKEEILGIASFYEHINENFAYCRLIKGKSKIKKAIAKGEKLVCYSE